MRRLKKTKESGIKYSEEEMINNIDTDEFVAKIVMRLAERDSSQKVIEKIEQTLNTLNTDYAVRHAETKSELRNLSELLLKQNGRVTALEGVVKLDREQHLQCPAHSKISVLEQKVIDNKETINEIKQNGTQKKTWNLAIISMLIAGAVLIVTLIDKIIGWI